MKNEFTKGFIEEVNDLLLQLEDDLIGLEKNPKNTEIINNIFRVMHTLKGSAGMVGFTNIQDLTHEFESIYEQIREGILKVDIEIIDVTLKAKDLIVAMLNEEADDAQSQELIRVVREKSGAKSPEHNGNQANKSGDKNRCVHRYVLLFEPDENIFERGLDPDKTLAELDASVKSHVLKHESKKSWDKQKAEKKCHTVWEIYICAPLGVPDIEDIFLFYDQDEYSIFEIDPGNKQLDPSLAERLSKLYKNKIKPDQHVKDCLDKLPEFEPELEQNIEPELEADTTSLAKNEEETVEEAPVSVKPKLEKEATVNVSSHKLDELMNLVSELVTLTATMEAHAEKFNDPKLSNTLENIEKLTKQFRNNALDLRLVPVGTLLNKFKRQVRDLSKELDKKVNLLIEGQDIEIDKTILKSIESPLQHIIRNSIDHGLEPEKERLEKGKTPDGLLKITAFYSGANVIIQVQDDGRGINLDKVRECALRKGYIQPDQELSREELIALIMEPGFTTSENITMVSGRGVGMDVVRKELNSVGGSLEVFTEENLGTSITMKLPTTLTIIDTLMVDVAESQVLIPVMDVEYCFKESSKDLFKKDNRYVEYKNNPIPLVSLREQFKYPASEEKDQMVIVINKFEKQYAITADHIIGEHQAVIKPLGELFVNQPFFSGGSIMVDGKLGFILDTNFLFNHVTKI